MPSSNRPQRVLLATGLALLAVFASCSKSAPEESPNAPAVAAPKTPLIQKTEVADWCKEHGVPESVCTRCNASLVAEFEAKGDWCKEHGLPESQCFECHPDLEAKFKAMAPKSGG